MQNCTFALDLNRKWLIAAPGATSPIAGRPFSAACVMISRCFFFLSSATTSSRICCRAKKPSLSVLMSMIASSCSVELVVGDVVELSAWLFRKLTYM